jgi:type IV secretion system protein VirD4
MREHDILLGIDPKGGGYIRFGGTESVALHARTRAGKGVSFVIPNAFAWKGSLVVFDIKGEIAKATAGYRKEVLKQDVFIVEPVARNGRSHRWDPFGSVDRTNPVDRVDQIWQIAYQLFPDSQEITSSGSNSAAFWEPVGRQAFAAVACIFAETPDLPLTMKAILNLFVRSDGPEWLAGLIADRLKAGDPYSLDAVTGVSDYVTGPEMQSEGIRKTVSTRLSAWTNPRIAAATSFSDLDLRQIRRKPTTIYIVVPPAAVPRMRPLLRLFFHQLIEANTDVTPEEDPSITCQVLLMMDEFIRLGRMADFAESLQYISGYGFRAALVVQSKPQIEARYGAVEAQDIFNNVGAEVMFSVNDIKLAREIEERLGDNTQTIVTLNRPRFWASFNWAKQSEAEHPHRRPLMLKQEVIGMERSKQIVFFGGRKDLTDRICWYTDPNFKDLVRPMPLPPILQLHVAYDDGTTRVLRRRDSEPATNLVSD